MGEQAGRSYTARGELVLDRFLDDDAALVTVRQSLPVHVESTYVPRMVVSIDEGRYADLSPASRAFARLDLEGARRLRNAIDAWVGVLGDPDPMPVFVLKAKDHLTPDVVQAYADLARRYGQHQDLGRMVTQANRAELALTEIHGWRNRHEDECAFPDHPHVPARGGS